MPARLADFEVFSDNSVTVEGELVHFALLADAEPISFEDAVKKEAWV